MSIEYDVISYYPRNPQQQEVTICPTIGQARKSADKRAEQGKVATVYRVRTDSLDYAYGDDAIVYRAEPQ